MASEFEIKYETTLSYFSCNCIRVYILASQVQQRMPLLQYYLPNNFKWAFRCAKTERRSEFNKSGSYIELFLASQAPDNLRVAIYSRISCEMLFTKRFTFLFLEKSFFRHEVNGSRWTNISLVLPILSSSNE